MATKKTAETVVSVPNTTPEGEGKKSFRLTAMQLACLSFYTAQQYEKATDEELGCTAAFPESIVQPLIEEGLLEVVDGITKATGFGIKWVLKSTTFGINFTKLFSEEVTPHTSTLHAALGALAPELARRHEKSPIYYFRKDGNEVSKFWNEFFEWVNMLDSCLQAEPNAE